MDWNKLREKKTLRVYLLLQKCGYEKNTESFICRSNVDIFTFQVLSISSCRPFRCSLLLLWDLRRALPFLSEVPIHLDTNIVVALYRDSLCTFPEKIVIVLDISRLDNCRIKATVAGQSRLFSLKHNLIFKSENLFTFRCNCCEFFSWFDRFWHYSNCCLSRIELYCEIFDHELPKIDFRKSI